MFECMTDLDEFFLCRFGFGVWHHMITHCAFVYAGLDLVFGVT
jgi:hypothetical protein